MRNSELQDLGRKIANATIGTGVDFADLADIISTTRGRKTAENVPNEVLERLREWFVREKPKMPHEIACLQVLVGDPKPVPAPAAPPAAPAGFTVAPLEAPPRDETGQDGEDAREAVEAFRPREKTVQSDGSVPREEA